MLEFMQRNQRPIRPRSAIVRRSRRISIVEILETRRLLAAIRVASYNVLQGSPNTSAEQAYYTTILEAIGNETKAGITRPVDLLVLQETNAGSVSSLESILDSLYADDYATILSPSYSGLAYGFVYNTASLQLLSSTNLTGGGFTRPPLRGHFDVIGSSADDDDFFVYSTHLKADPGGASERGIEAALLRADADALGEGENVLIVGDFNMKTSFEAAYQTLTSGGPGQVHDPINQPGNWNDNPQFKEWHTQDPGANMDDRFDLQLISGELLTPGGLDYVVGSYRVFGNNNTHSLGGTLTGTGASATVLNALRNASDHLPVVVDYSFDTVVAGITVVQTDGNTAVTEGAAPDTYSIVLDSVPTSNVTITIDPDSQLDLGAGAGVPLDFTFTPASALIPQNVQVWAFDDSVVEGPHGGLIGHTIVTSDANYAALTIDDIPVGITDNEQLPPASVVISEIMYNPATIEGSFSPEWVEIVNVGSVAQDISGWTLDDEDAANWGAIPSSTVLQSGQVAILYDGQSTAITTEAGFRATWNVPANALVIGVDWPDLDNDPSVANEILQLKDGNALVQDSVNFDDESPWPVDSPEGPSIYLTNLLADNNDGSNWARSVIGVDGAVSANGFPFSNLDVGSPGVVPAVVLGTLVITESDGSTVVTEGAANDTISIQFDSLPADDVTVTLTPDGQLDLGGGAGVAVTRTFSTTDALTPQAVVVTAFDDLINEGPHAGTIHLSTSSNDPAFNGLIVPSLNVSIFDNDGGAFIEINGTVQEFAGPGTYAVEFFVTAFNGPVTIGGFNVPLLFGANDVSFSGQALDYTPAPVFDINLVVPLPTPFLADYGFQSTASVGGLSIAAGQTEKLFTANLVAGFGANIPSLTEVAEIVSTGMDADLISFSDELFSPLTVTFGTANLFSPSIAPVVTDVIVAGVAGPFAWTPTFIDAVDGGGSGSGNGLGYSVFGTTRTVPWYTVDTIYIQFSEDVNVSAADLFGVSVADYAGNFSVSTAGSLATITMATPFGLPELDLGPATTGIDKLLLRLHETAVTDLAGNPMAAEFNQRIDLLPGDGSGNGSVNNQDVGLTNLRGFLSTTNPGPNEFNFFYDPFFDITANGSINNQDVGLTNFQGFDELPSGDPLPPVQRLAASSPIQRKRYDDATDWRKSVDELFRQNQFNELLSP